VSGSSKEKLYNLEVSLPKKHRKGGQSSARFGRIRDEKRHWYLCKVAEACVKSFISNGEKVNVEGIIIAGSSEIKNELMEELDPRILAKVLQVIDVQYGGENGFNEAVLLSGSILKGLSFFKEKQLLSQFFASVALDDGLSCYGIDETLAALEAGAVSKLIVSQQLSIPCFIVRNISTNRTRLITSLRKMLGVKKSPPKTLLEEEEYENGSSSHEKEESEDHPVEQLEEQVDLLDWLTENFKTFGASLELVTNHTSEGKQFDMGFGGCAARLRYRFVPPQEDEDEDENEDYDDEKGEDFAC